MMHIEDKRFVIFREEDEGGRVMMLTDEERMRPEAELRSALWK